jgi:hypothetical protein
VNRWALLNGIGATWCAAAIWTKPTERRFFGVQPTLPPSEVISHFRPPGGRVRMWRMSRLFISHSSANNAIALALRPRRCAL